MSDAEWYYTTGEGTRGPLDTAQLLALLRSSALSPDVMVWSPGWSEWRPARTVPELEPTLQRPPRAAAPARPSRAWLLVHAWGVANLVLLLVVVLTALGRLR